MGNLLKSESTGKFILRLTVGILLLFHGVSKLLHPAALGFIKTHLIQLGLPPVVAYGVYVGEVIAPLMLVFGLFSRLAGLIVAVNMVFAILLVHTGDLFSLTKNGGWALQLEGFFLLCGLVIFFLGSGRFAVRPD